MFHFWFNTFFVPWHMNYQEEEEKRAAVEVWIGNTLDKGHITSMHNRKNPYQRFHPFGNLHNLNLSFSLYVCALNFKFISRSLSSHSD